MTIECNDEHSNVFNPSVKLTVVFNNAEKTEALKINRRYFDIVLLFLHVQLR